MLHRHRTEFETRYEATYHCDAPTTTTSQQAVHGIESQSDGPSDYRPQIVPSNPRNGHGQANSQIHQQQQYSQQQYSQGQYPQSQQWRQQQTHHPGVQARYLHQTHAMAVPHLSSKQRNLVAESAPPTLLSYCTVDIPLNKGQVIAVTGVAASLKELVLLALGAKDGDEECATLLKDALGSEQAAAGIVGFFSGEFEIE